MRIGLDFDGVIADCTELKHRIAKELYGISIPHHQLDQSLIKREKIIPLPLYNKIKNHCYTQPAHAMTMKPIADALHVIALLIKDGHELTIITSRNDKAIYTAQQWTALHNIDIPIIGVGSCASKTFAAQGMDVFVDDHLHKLNDLITVVPHLFLFHQLHNSMTPLPDSSIKRMNSWQDIYEAIQKISV